jgi:hypothetical protein
MWGALSDEKSGLEFSDFCRALPAQPFSDLSPTGLMSMFYCLYFLDSPSLEGQVPVFTSPGNRVAQLYPRAFRLLPFHYITYDIDRIENIAFNSSAVFIMGGCC